MINGLTLNQPDRAKILIVDNQPLVREGLVCLIGRQNDLACCGQADSCESTLKSVKDYKPDVVTIEIRLQNGNGLDLIKCVKADHPSVRILVISQCDETYYAERALKMGAHGYLMKEQTTEEVLKAIRTILADGLYVSSKIAALALFKMARAKSNNDGEPMHNLSNREMQVLQLLGAGLGTRIVAVKLGLSIKTIETHRENIKNKTGISSAAELIRFATGWVNGQSPKISPFGAVI